MSYLHSNKCVDQHCSKPKIGTSLYCYVHKCKMCNNMYNCIVHTCVCESCFQPKTTNSMYCVYHKCKICNSSVFECTEHKCQFKHVCSIHTCQQTINNITNKYCGYHKCTNKYCENNIYCIEHKCQFVFDSSKYSTKQLKKKAIQKYKYGKCRTTKIDKYEYCSLHKCTHQFCFNNVYCPIHFVKDVI